MSYNYNEVSLNNLFESGTTPGTSYFKINNINFNSLYKAYTSGYKAYFNQNILTNNTSIPLFFPYMSNGASIVPVYNLNPNIFFSIVGSTNITIPTGYNYAYRFNSDGNIRFNTDTLVNVWLVGGGGSGGMNSNNQDGGGGEELEAY